MTSNIVTQEQLEKCKPIRAPVRHTLYGIDAGELHRMLIEYLLTYCRHFGIRADDILSNEGARPLEQTIGMILTRARG